MTLALRIHVAARRVGIDAAILMPQPVEHEFGTVAELNAQPVPAGFIAAIDPVKNS